MDKAACGYIVDEQDRLIGVSGHWNQFAVENRAPELAQERILNKPLWDFIAGDETIDAYKRLLNHCRAGGNLRSFQFRCDAPDLRRFMNLDIARAADSKLLLKTRLVREEARESIRLLETAESHTDDILTICSQCKRAKLEREDRWVEVEEAMETLGIPNTPPVPHLSHGLCPRCYEEVSAQLD